MELEAVLAFLKALPDAEYEKTRRIIMAVEYAIQKRQSDAYRINELESAMVEHFLREFHRSDSHLIPRYYNPSEDDE
jgi:hypothetical protein